MTTTNNLRCLRCGDWADMDPFEMYGWGLCRDCWDRHPDLGLPGEKNFARAFHRWRERYQRDCERHPTYKALMVAFRAEEARIAALGASPW